MTTRVLVNKVDYDHQDQLHIEIVETNQDVGTPYYHDGYPQLNLVDDFEYTQEQVEMSFTVLATRADTALINAEVDDSDVYRHYFNYFMKKLDCQFIHFTE